MVRYGLWATALLATTLLTPAVVQAQRYGGYRGGFHSGGGYYGGFRYGAPAYGYYHHGYGAYPFRYGYGIGSYYRPYAYPGYASSYYPSDYAYVAPSVTTYQSNYYVAPTVEVGNTALVDVYLPTPDAAVWFGDYPTQQTGTARQFQSPPLAPGRNFTYNITARWTVGGQPVQQTRAVVVQAGSRAAVDFNQPAP